MVPPHTVMLLVVQSLSTELGLSAHPGAPELLTQTWQTLDESRLFLKVPQPHSLRVTGTPSENRDAPHLLPTAPRNPPSPDRSGSGVRGKRTGVGLAGSPTEPGGAGASPARELLLFTPRQADERPRSLGAQRLQGSITAITSRSQTGCRQRWGKSLFRVWLCQREGKKCLGMRRGVKEPLLYEGQKSEGGWVFAGEEGAPGTAALFCQCHWAALGAWAASSTLGHSGAAHKQPSGDCRENQTSWW